VRKTGGELDRPPSFQYFLSIMSLQGRKLIDGLLAALGVLCLPGISVAIEIVSPKDGAEIPIGSEVVVQVQPSPDDDIVRVYMSGSEEAMKYNDKTGFFEQRVKLRGDAFGSIPVEVTSINSKNVTSTATVYVDVKLPPVLPLISLRIHAEQRKLVLEGIGEKQNLQVIGEFPDGTVRVISAVTFGTKYAINDENIATVDANGWVTAMALGETTIVVRNGEKETQGKIVVRPKPSDGEKKDT
jgi:hypothetical protein